jgi:hypothetical protein
MIPLSQAWELELLGLSFILCALYLLVTKQKTK